MKLTVVASITAMFVTLSFAACAAPAPCVPEEVAALQHRLTEIEHELAPLQAEHAVIELEMEECRTRERSCDRTALNNDYQHVWALMGPLYEEAQANRRRQLPLFEQARQCEFERAREELGITRN